MPFRRFRNSYPVVPAMAQFRGSASPGLRIFSATM
jgi:hypothetical protein